MTNGFDRPLLKSLGSGDLIAARFRVRRTLGSGGMGVVLEAADELTGGAVAIKLLSPHLIGSVQVDRFFREARAGAKVASQHVARVLDFGTIGGRQPFMVMECLRGRDLGERLRREKRIPLGEVADCMIQACEALAHAHGEGIVHRDIKPSNLFEHEGPNGVRVLKVLDFGISKSSADDADWEALTTSRDGLLGSPPYMSPEQVRDPHCVDHRTDIWSLGVVAYRLLSSKLPFDGVCLGEIFAAVLDRPYASLREIGVTVPDAVEAILARCLERDPARRFADVSEVAQAFAPFASARGRAIAERAREVTRRKPPVLAKAAPRAAQVDEEPRTLTLPPARPPWAAKRSVNLRDSLPPQQIAVVLSETGGGKSTISKRERLRAAAVVATGFAIAAALTLVGSTWTPPARATPPRHAATEAPRAIEAPPPPPAEDPPPRAQPSATQAHVMTAPPRRANEGELHPDPYEKR
jgi:serine/threonine-protein kinase